MCSEYQLEIWKSSKAAHDLNMEDRLNIDWDNCSSLLFSFSFQHVHILFNTIVLLTIVDSLGVKFCDSITTMLKCK